MNKFIFLDRDGVLNKDPKETYYVHDLSEFHWVDGVIDGLKALQENEFKIVILSNQSGVGKGEVTSESLAEITQHIYSTFSENKLPLEDIYYCMHAPDENCFCRKPKTGLYEEFEKKCQVDKENSFSIGDSERDIEAAQRFGVKAILVLTGKSSQEDLERFNCKPDYVAVNMKEAVSWIQNQKKS